MENDHCKYKFNNHYIYIRLTNQHIIKKKLLFVTKLSTPVESKRVEKFCQCIFF